MREKWGWGQHPEWDDAEVSKILGHNSSWLDFAFGNPMGKFDLFWDEEGNTRNPYTSDTGPRLGDMYEWGEGLLQSTQFPTSPTNNATTGDYRKPTPGDDISSMRSGNPLVKIFEMLRHTAQPRITTRSGPSMGPNITTIPEQFSGLFSDPVPEKIIGGPKTSLDDTEDLWKSKDPKLTPPTLDDILGGVTSQQAYWPNSKLMRDSVPNNSEWYRLLIQKLTNLYNVNPNYFDNLRN